MHVARELLRAAGQPVSWGRALAPDAEGASVVLFAHDEEESGVLAARLAADVVERAREGVALELDDAAQEIAEARQRGLPGPSTRHILDEAAARGIPAIKLDESHYQMGWGARQARIQATLTSRTSAIAVETADDKTRTKEILAQAGVRVPHGGCARTFPEAARLAERLGYPVVVKPREGNHGRGVTVGVADEEELAAAFERAREVDRDVLVEDVLQGADFRILVIGHRFVAAARRDPAHVVGDGQRTVRQLVDATNADPRRGVGHEKPLTRIVVDDESRGLLAKQGLGLDDVPGAERVVRLKSTANLSSGGTSTDVTDEVHASVREMAERVSRAIDLDVCGIDVVAPHLSAPLEETRGGVCEVNAAPGFRMHVDPSHGRGRNVAAPLLDTLFPAGSPARIPLVAVTGTNGKTTTARLVAHVLASAGGKVGLACTDGVEVRGRRTLSGDYSGPSGAEAVLKDATVTHAVLEVARGGILRRGLGFDECDVGVLLNVASDHLGSEGVHTLDDLLHVKATVVGAVKRDGVAVLNAEDERCLAAAARCRGRVVLFALDPKARAVREHVAKGGEAVVVREGAITRLLAGGATPIARLDAVPLTLGGRAECNVKNALAATAAALALGLTAGDVAAALASFHPTPAHVPGRLNLFEKGGVKVLVDYGHNPPALKALESTLTALHHGRRIVSASATGNRRDVDLREFGEWLGRLYDEIHLSDADPRGRARGETPRLVREGIERTAKPSTIVDVLPDEEATIETALARASPGDLVVLQAEDVDLAIRLATRWSLDEAPAPPVPIHIDVPA
jgi:cyanophycin synthetase